MELYKHVNNTDVAMEIMSCRRVEDLELLRLKVRWWNIGKCHSPFDMGIEQQLTIKLSDWYKWEPYEYLPMSG